MAISFVNGYACANCSDTAKAKQGIDPNQNPVETANELSKAQQTNATLEPRAVSEAGEGADVRARLDFTQALDLLV